MSFINTILNPLPHLLPENNRVERIWKLAQVDFKKRYYNDKLGIFWALINPACRIAIYFFVFKNLLKIEIENYALFLFAGLLLWMAFSESTNKSMALIRSKRYLIENIQFNQIDLFISNTISVFMGLIFNLIAFLIISFFAGISLSWNLLFLFVLLINVFLICLGTSLILATLQVYLKDIVHLWTIAVLLGFWTSGIFFKGEDLIKIFAPIIYFNPFIGIIMNMRKITMYSQAPNFYHMGVSMAFGILILLFGIFFYKKFSYKALELL